MIKHEGYENKDDVITNDIALLQLGEDGNKRAS